MPTNNTTVIGNMFDVLKFETKDGSPIRSVGATMAERDDFTRLVPAYPASSGRFHEGLRQVALPTGYLVDVGGSWKASKAEFEPITESLCTIKSTYQCPKDVYQNCSKEVGMAKYKANRSSHIMSLLQGMMNMMLNGPTTPNQSAIVGLMQRAPYTTYDNLFTFSAGGAGNDLRSGWLIKPGIDTFHALYNGFHPTMGVEVEDMGPQLIQSLGTGSDEHRWDLMTEFMLQKGIHIEDQRAVKRICNVACGVTDNPGSDLINTIIDAATINKPTGGNLITYDAQMQPVSDIPSPWIYFCDERQYSKLLRANNDKNVVVMSAENIYRTEMLTIGQGQNQILIAQMDALAKTLGSGETAVAAA